MGALGASSVTYTLLNQRKMSDSRSLNRVRLAFGNASDTYPSGGIPLTIGKMGCPTVIESMVVVDKGTSGYSFMYDQDVKKLVMFQAPAQTHTHDLFIRDNTIADAAANRINANTNALSTNTGANVTVSGTNAATSGGILSATLAAAAGVQPTSVAIAAQTIEVEVIGW